MEPSCVSRIVFGNLLDISIVNRRCKHVFAQQIKELLNLVMGHDCRHLEVVPLHVPVPISREPRVLIEVVFLIRFSPRKTSKVMLLPVVSAPHGPLANERLTASIFLEKLINLGLDFSGRDRSTSTLCCVVGANFVFTQPSIAVTIDCIVEWLPFVELNIVLLDR